MPTPLPYAQDLINGAIPQAQTAIAGANAGANQSTADATARFGPALGHASEAIMRNNNTMFAGQQGQAARGIQQLGEQWNFKASQDQLKLNAQSDEAARQRDLDNLLTKMSMNQRQSEINMAMDESAKKKENAILAAIMAAGGSLIGSGSAGSSIGEASFPS